MVGFADELSSGIAVVAAPAVEREQELDHSGYTLFVFAAPLLLAALLEAGLALWSHKISRRRFLVGGVLALSLALALTAGAPWPWLFSLGLAAAGAASGSACGAAEAELLALQPDEPERAMTRWTFFAALGDVAAPLVVASLLAVGRSYRDALLGVAALLVLHAVWLGRKVRTRSTGAGAREVVASGVEAEAEEPDGPDSTEPEVPLLRALREAARCPPLWAWLFGSATCTLLDEIVIALAALRMHADLGASEATAVAWTIAYATGSAVGALAADRLLLRTSPRAVLAGSAVSSAVCLGVVILAPSLEWLVPSMFALGMTASAQFPIAKARAFAAVPGAPGVVNALGQAFVVLDIAAPIALGLIAVHGGLELALACLLLQPLTMLALSYRWPSA